MAAIHESVSVYVAFSVVVETFADQTLLLSIPLTIVKEASTGPLTRSSKCVAP